MKEKGKWFEDNVGNKSLMRLVVFMLTCTSISIVTAGITGWFLGMEGAPTIIGSASLLGIGGEAFKFLQKGKESA